VIGGHTIISSMHGDRQAPPSSLSSGKLPQLARAPTEGTHENKHTKRLVNGTHSFLARTERIYPLTLTRDTAHTRHAAATRAQSRHMHGDRQTDRHTHTHTQQPPHTKINSCAAFVRMHMHTAITTNENENVIGGHTIIHHGDRQAPPSSLSWQATSLMQLARAPTEGTHENKHTTRLVNGTHSFLARTERIYPLTLTRNSACDGRSVDWKTPFFAYTLVAMCLFQKISMPVQNQPIWRIQLCTLGKFFSEQ
jgi:hypothetical protein